MLELQERPADQQWSTGGLAASRDNEAKPKDRPPGRTSEHSGRLPLWSHAQQRRLAGANLVTVVIMAVTGLGAATGFQPLEAPAAVGRLVKATLGIGSEAADVANRPPVHELLPYGKGMWLYEPDKTEGGNVQAIVAKAKAVGLSHLYVRTGSSWDGFYAGPFLDKLLPAAQEANLMVYGWDFPRLINWEEDVKRAKAAIEHRTPGKHRLDGFSADIETRSEGTHISGEVAAAYGKALREAVGSSFPLIATVPRPSPAQNFPYAQVVESFDAVAPMVYWLNRQPDTDVTGALRDLAQYGKPVFPVGQAYDGAPEGGRAGVPPPEELWRFMRFAQAHGAQGVSFWSWQAANAKAWAAITEAEEFRDPAPWMVEA
ncbi:MAG: hypothetical protein ACRD1D_12790 [Acidimicrobiales bacterium]